MDITLRLRLLIGKPDGYWQIFGVVENRAFCLSFKHGLQTGFYAWTTEEGMEFHTRHLR